MSAASIVMRDDEDGNVNLEVVFAGGFDRDSQAHAGVRRLLDMLDGMGIEVQEPINGEEAIGMAAPETRQ